MEKADNAEEEEQSENVRNLTLSNRRKLPKQNKWVAVTPEIIDIDLSLSNLEITREQLVDVSILMGTDFNPGINGIGPKKGLKLIKECGNAEEALVKIGKDIDNLDEIRNLFLNQRPQIFHIFVFVTYK